MKLVVFGLSISSSWGNGHATLWRGLQRALARRGWVVVFFERDVEFYAAHRDLRELTSGELHLYPDWNDVRASARDHLKDADAAIVTSYCPDGPSAISLVLDAGRPIRIFYDLDTPVTLRRLQQGEAVDYLGPFDLSGFDLVLSFTGGGALDELKLRLKARRVAPLYGHVDPTLHRRGAPQGAYRGDLSYIGTYAEDRQRAVDELFLRPARERPRLKFILAGAQYPPQFPWSDNVYFVHHLPPAEHPDFYASSRLTLNVTRESMARMGWCPSGRLFEAAACGATLITDRWSGLEDFFLPGRDLLVADSGEDVMSALDLDESQLAKIASAGRDRVLSEHTADRRAMDFEGVLAGLQREETPATMSM